MTTPTYTYRLYTYKNGLDETVYRAKRKGFLGLFCWMGEHPHDPYAIFPTAFVHDEWTTRESAMVCITHDANLHRRKSQAKTEETLRADLKLVIIEDVEA